MSKKKRILSLVIACLLGVTMLAGCTGQESSAETVSSGSLTIAEQGMFSAGGTVTTSEGTFDVSNYYTSREGSTSHVDHANVFYQIPENETGLPMVFLHGYGQSRMDG